MCKCLQRATAIDLISGSYLKNQITLEMRGLEVQKKEFPGFRSHSCCTIFRGTSVDQTHTHWFTHNAVHLNPLKIITSGGLLFIVDSLTLPYPPCNSCNTELCVAHLPPSLFLSDYLHDGNIFLAVSAWNTIPPLSMSCCHHHTSIHLFLSFSRSLFPPASSTHLPELPLVSCPTPVLLVDWSVAKTSCNVSPLPAPSTTQYTTLLAPSHPSSRSIFILGNFLSLSAVRVSDVVWSANCFHLCSPHLPPYSWPCTDPHPLLLRSTPLHFSQHPTLPGEDGAFTSFIRMLFSLG